ncbi:dihydrolipoamide acetyltransferase component of pyruvate dehydrogenase complex [Sporomusaceae bacterium FL31]|nr:dihydrolipoamide acetyltransferase component of pyruvate dehydrogenase complex [Sporomusaceae bacterium FL31]GCE34630.1 dihydrolipoamide acetyltransferase component of pyruvate dehydrogenase complex [Sporomusaceae bacterium]
MAMNIIMPQLGLTMTEGTVVKWLKAIGEPVAKGEVLVEITTDKIGGQIEAPGDGTLLAIACAEGSSVPVTSVLAVIGSPDEVISIESHAPKVMEEHQSSVGLASKQDLGTVSDSGWLKASPAAKKMARDHQIKLALVTATGPEGRIVERDVKAYLEHLQAKPPVSPLALKLANQHDVDLGAVKKQGRIMSADVLQVIAMQQPEFQSKTSLSGMRKAIAERMSLSWRTAPHVTLTMAVDMTAAGQLRQQLNQADSGKISYTDIVVKCTAAALQEHVIMTATLIDKEILVPAGLHIGIAVALEDGLIVPVIRNAAQLGLAEIRNNILDLSTRAKAGKLQPDEISGSVFTITNLGMYGVDWFTPVINPPEAAILGVCRIQDTPVALNGELLIRPMMNLCLSFDHRLIDGAVAAKFLSRVRELLEHPLLLLS